MGGGKKVSLPKICHTYPTNMKLGTVIPYLKKTQEIYESREAPLEFCRHQHFFMGKMFWVFKDFLINMVTILMMSAKLGTPGLLKIKIFQNKGYDVIVLAYGITNQILPCDSNYFLDVVMWSKFANSSISMRKVIITWNLEEWSSIICIIFWDFLMFYQIFSSPQLKRFANITYKHGTYKLSNNLRLRILGN